MRARIYETRCSRDSAIRIVSDSATCENVFWAKNTHNYRFAVRIKGKSVTYNAVASSSAGRSNGQWNVQQLKLCHFHVPFPFSISIMTNNYLFLFIILWRHQHRPPVPSRAHENISMSYYSFDIFNGSFRPTENAKEEVRKMSDKTPDTTCCVCPHTVHIAIEPGDGKKSNTQRHTHLALCIFAN